MSPRILDFDAALDRFVLPPAQCEQLAHPWAQTFGATGSEAVQSGATAMPFFKPEADGTIAGFGAPTLAFPGFAPLLDESPGPVDVVCLGWQWLRNGRKPLHLLNSRGLCWGLDIAANVDPADSDSGTACAVICEGPKDTIALDNVIYDRGGTPTGLWAQGVFTLGCAGANTAASVLRRCEDVFRSIHGRSLPRIVVVLDGDAAGTNEGIKVAQDAAKLGIDCRVLVMPFGVGYDAADAHRDDVGRLAERVTAAACADNPNAGSEPLVAAYNRNADSDCRERWLAAWRKARNAQDALQVPPEAHWEPDAHQRRTQPHASSHRPNMRPWSQPTADELIRAVVSCGAVRNSKASNRREWRGSCPVCGGTKRLAIWDDGSAGRLKCYDCADNGVTAFRLAVDEIKKTRQAQRISTTATGAAS